MLWDEMHCVLLSCIPLEINLNILKQQSTSDRWHFNSLSSSGAGIGQSNFLLHICWNCSSTYLAVIVPMLDRSWGRNYKIESSFSDWSRHRNYKIEASFSDRSRHRNYEQWSIILLPCSRLRTAKDRESKPNNQKMLVKIGYTEPLVWWNCATWLTLFCQEF